MRDVCRLFHIEKIHRVPAKLLPHAKRKHNQSFAIFVAQDLTAEFQLLQGFTETERFEQSAAASVQGPNHRVTLVRLQRRAKVFR